MIILGLDPSQATGWALYDTSAPLSAIRAGTVKVIGDDYEHKAASLGLGLVKIIKADRPDFIAIEMPLRAAPRPPKKKARFMGEETEEEMPSGPGLNALISSNQMVGAISAIVGAYRIPFEMVKDSVWRRQFLGFGTHKEWQRKDWKRAVRERCMQMRITVTNDDMADAVGVAFAGAACQTFKMLKAGRAA